MDRKGIITENHDSMKGNLSFALHYSGVVTSISQSEVWGC